MFVDRKQPRWSRQSVFYAASLFILLLFGGTLAACGGQPAPDRPLIQNGTLSNDGAAGTAIIASSKTIKPIEIVSEQSNLTSYANGKMSLTITTSPYAICNFIVSYGMSTPSKSFGIRPVTADAQGIASWQWDVEGKAATGIWPLKITATLVNGAQTTQTRNVTVILPPIHLDSTKSVLNVARKGEATLAIVTAPSVSSTITMSYTSKVKTFKGTTDGKGGISWTWRVEAGANPGSYPLTITVTTGSGEQEQATFPITIQ